MNVGEKFIFHEDTFYLSCLIFRHYYDCRKYRNQKYNDLSEYDKTILIKRVGEILFLIFPKKDIKCYDIYTSILLFLLLCSMRRC